MTGAIFPAAGSAVIPAKLQATDPRLLVLSGSPIFLVLWLDDAPIFLMDNDETFFFTL